MKLVLLEQKLNSFAIRSFRDTGDRDYVHARLAFKTRLVPQFFWSALHCLEKYLKGTLLINRVPCKDISHSVTPLLERMADVGPFTLFVSDGTLALLDRLEGMAEYRYFQVSYFSHDVSIYDLDLAVWEIRRYCQVLDYSRLPEAANLPPLTLELQRLAGARDAGQKGTCLSGGWIEDVIAKPKHPARQALLWNNLFFGPSRRKRIRVPAYEESGNAPLFLHPEIVDEVRKYIKMEKPVADMWREEAARRARETL